MNLLIFQQKHNMFFSKSVQQTKQNCIQQFQTTQELLGIQKDTLNKHTNQVFQKYQNKKIQLNMTVKQTMQQMQDVLPLYTTRANPMNQTKTAQFFYKALMKKVMNASTKTKLK